MERPSRCVYGVPVCTDKLPPRVAEYLSNPVCEFVPPKYKPIMHIDGYIRGMGLTGEKEKLYRKLYTPPPEPECVGKEFPDVPSDPLHVFTNIRVTKNGVKVKITVPMEPVYLAQKKGTLPSLEVRVRAAKGFGYSDEILTQMIQNDDTRKSRGDKLEDFIDSVFGKCASAKTNKPKKKTIQEHLNAKFKKKPAKKYS